MVNLRKTAVAIATAGLLQGCGGSNINTGVFLDSAVSGVMFETESGTGFTDKQGRFQYRDGESVVFSIGGLMLPSVAASNTVTPLDIAGTNDITCLLYTSPSPRDS